jgi:hypothetical protein
MRRLAQGRTQPLSRHFQQPKSRDSSDLDPGPIGPHGVPQPVFDLALILLWAHVNEINDQQAAEIAKPALASDFISRFKIGDQGRSLDIFAFSRPCGVDVNRYQRFSVIDDDAAT